MKRIIKIVDRNSWYCKIFIVECNRVRMEAFSRCVFNKIVIWSRFIRCRVDFWVSFERILLLFMLGNDRSGFRIFRVICWGRSSWKCGFSSYRDRILGVWDFQRIRLLGRDWRNLLYGCLFMVEGCFCLRILVLQVLIKAVNMK